MKLFNCPNCQELLFFESLSCINCGTPVAYLLEQRQFAAQSEGENWPCVERDTTGCNWASISLNAQCFSCKLTEQVPPAELKDENYSQLEAAKRRLLYQLMRLGLPVDKKTADTPWGISFNFLPANNQQGLVTGHANGVLTILLSEADSVKRESMRKKMSEPYRTLLGHLRHEIGHYYWPLLIDEGQLTEFRKVFGDEQEDYTSALQRHYNDGPIPGWNTDYISAYASSHPWEDWAETWAHYLHIMDTLETAHSYNINLNAQLSSSDAQQMVTCPDPYQTGSFQTILEANIALTNAVNSLNRSMGIADIYPFVITQSVVSKLEFIHNLLRVKSKE